MRGMGWTQHSLDPALFLRWSDPDSRKPAAEPFLVGLCGFHVDDCIATFAPDFPHIKAALQSAFEWGGAWEVDAFTFCGKEITRQATGTFRSPWPR